MQVFYPYLLNFLIHVEQLMVNFYRTTINLYIFFVHWQTIPFFFNIYYIFDCARSLRWFPCRRARALGSQALVVVAHELRSCSQWALEHRLSSRDTQAQLLGCLWDLLGSGTEPTSPALPGRFFTTGPPGNLPNNLSLKRCNPKLYNLACTRRTKKVLLPLKTCCPIPDLHFALHKHRCDS